MPSSPKISTPIQRMSLWSERVKGGTTIRRVPRTPRMPRRRVPNSVDITRRPGLRVLGLHLRNLELHRVAVRPGSVTGHSTSFCSTPTPTRDRTLVSRTGVRESIGCLRWLHLTSLPLITDAGSRSGLDSWTRSSRRSTTAASSHPDQSDRGDQWRGAATSPRGSLLEQRELHLRRRYLDRVRVARRRSSTARGEASRHV